MAEGSVEEGVTGGSGANRLSGDVNEGANGTDEYGLRRSTWASDDRGLGPLMGVVVSASSMISALRIPAFLSSSLHRSSWNLPNYFTCFV